MRPREVRRWRGVCVASKGKESVGVASSMLLGDFQFLRTGCVSTMREMRTREVRRWWGVGVALRAKERGRCRFVNVTGRFPMSSDWFCEHKERNATKGGASMEGFLCCLQSERKRCRFVYISGSFPMVSDCVREHKETYQSKGGAPMAWCWCCLKSERKR